MEAQRLLLSFDKEYFLVKFDLTPSLEEFAKVNVEFIELMKKEFTKVKYYRL